MTYDEAIDSTVTQSEAIKEVKAHCVEMVDFFDELGVKDEYQGADVLAFLGY
jgi:hypothetical protein